MTRFSYIHVSDTHLCIQHGRRNALTQINRNLRVKIDTMWQQGLELGFDTLAKPASYVSSIISGVAQFCLAKSAVTDAIVFTGDIATTGITDDLDVAKRFVSAQASRGFVSANRFPTLNASGVPIFVMPGNHDRYEDDIATPNCKKFDQEFSAYMPNCSSGVGYWIDEKENCLVAFVYADFTLQARPDALDKAIAVYGQGRVYDHVLQLLKKKTHQLQTENPITCVVWVIHFAPFECGYRLRLIDYHDLLRSAEELGVTALLCGHTHDASVTTERGYKIYCSGSAGCIDREDDARVHVLNIDVNGACSTSRENYRWNPEQNEFIFVDTD